MQKQENRSQRFRNRIVVERAVLSIVNESSQSRHTPLAGLTSAAINDWEQRASANRAHVSVRNVAHHLHAIARAAGIIVDNSRAIFDQDDEEIGSEIEELKGKLIRLLTGEAS
ncbi:hypothetical protein [Mesorhizobium sp.]|uniref:hypothetical protein n=1 Tax=Mesorhizobium sp. TaxID=1871066 RepID=UPI0025C73BF0|nr:hypothetical protein [Mesorhizobium sp.]